MLEIADSWVLCAGDMIFDAKHAAVIFYGQNYGKFLSCAFLDVSWFSGLTIFASIFG
jgi:hypothetical protein